MEGGVRNKRLARVGEMESELRIGRARRSCGHLQQRALRHVRRVANHPFLGSFDDRRVDIPVSVDDSMPCPDNTTINEIPFPSLRATSSASLNNPLCESSKYPTNFLMPKLDKRQAVNAAGMRPRSGR